MPVDKASIFKKVRIAIKDYAEFTNEEVEAAVEKAFDVIESDMDTGGYEQSTKVDAAEAALEAAMNEADEQAEGSVEKEDA